MMYKIGQSLTVGAGYPDHRFGHELSRHIFFGQDFHVVIRGQTELDKYSIFLRPNYERPVLSSKKANLA